MSNTPLELRIQTLEQQMQDIFTRIQAAQSPRLQGKDWRKSLGLFDDHPVMRQIDAAGELVRQKDREQSAT